MDAGVLDRLPSVLPFWCLIPSRVSVVLLTLLSRLFNISTPKYQLTNTRIQPHPFQKYLSFHQDSVIAAKMDLDLSSNDWRTKSPDELAKDWREECIRDMDPSWREYPSSMSFEELSAAFEKCVQHLRNSDCHEVLTRFFDHEHEVRITQCICLALGHFGTRRDADPRFGEFVGPLHQLAVLTVLLQVLRTKHDIPHVYFQDPLFGIVEIAFLRSLGYTVLDNPDAFGMMSPSTFLFAPYCPDDVNCWALRSSFPALYIGPRPQLVSWAIVNGQNVWERLGARQIDMLFRFDRSTTGGESMMPSFDREEWVTNAQVRWLHPGCKYIDKGSAVMFFFFFRLVVSLLMTWKRMKRDRYPSDWEKIVKECEGS